MQSMQKQYRSLFLFNPQISLEVLDLDFHKKMCTSTYQIQKYSIYDIDKHCRYFGVLKKLRKH